MANLKSLGQFEGKLVSIWQTFEPNLANFYAMMTISCSCKWPKIEKIILPYGHTDGEIKNNKNNKIRVLDLCFRRNQCDQIWQNFTQVFGPFFVWFI